MIAVTRSGVCRTSALLSGFCDQAAFTRGFSRVEHITPSNWRRAYSNVTATNDEMALASRSIEQSSPVLTACEKRLSDSGQPD